MHTDVNIPYIEKHPEYLMSTRTLSDNKQLDIFEKYNDKTKRIEGYWKIIQDNREKKNYYSMRVYEKDEFIDMCRKIGFQKGECYSEFSKNSKYSIDKPEMIIVSRKGD